MLIYSLLSWRCFIKFLFMKYLGGVYLIVLSQKKKSEAKIAINFRGQRKLDEFIGGGIAYIVVKFISRPSNGLAKDSEAIA